VLDYRVEPTDSHDLNSPEVSALSRRLLARHQELLADMTGSDRDASRRGKESL
jgi:hypothetical protein